MALTQKAVLLLSLSFAVTQAARVSRKKRSRQQGQLGVPHHDAYEVVDESGNVSDGPQMLSTREWIIGAEGQSCSQACATASLGSCIQGELDGLNTRSFALAAFASAGTQCTSTNDWDYGSGPGQCTNNNCCQGSCIGVCNLPRTQSCSTRGSGDFGRLCPCAMPSKKTNFECAVANDAKQKRMAPGWRYVGLNGERAPNNRKQPMTVAWEPVLERVPQCIIGRQPKEFKFLVGLDATWVEYYNQHARHFRTQGFYTLVESAQMWFNHVTYLFEKQFNIRISISRTVALPELDNACGGDNGAADGRGNTSIKEMLGRRGISKKSNEAGIIRLGVGVPSRYCDSYAGLGALCSSNILVMQAKPFSGNDGVINTRAISTLAHELGHHFGICGGGDAACLNGHNQNEVPDVMVWDGMPVLQVRREGMFFKFMTECSHVYTTKLCKRARQATCVR